MRCGIIASSHRATGGGPSVTVDAIEVIPQSLPGNVDASLSVTTTLTANDRVVVIAVKRATASTPAISGLGATWTSDAASTSTYDVNVWSATGVTGTGTITVTGLGTGPSDVIAYVLRASNGAAINLVNAQALAFGAVTAGTVRSTTGAATTTGAFVAGVAFVSASTISFPTSSTPASGWTTDYTNGTLVKAVHQTLAAGATVQLGATSSGIFGCALVQAIYQV